MKRRTDRILISCSPLSCVLACTLLALNYSDKEDYVFTLLVCLFVSMITLKLLDRVSQNSVKRWNLGHGIRFRCQTGWRCVRARVYEIYANVLRNADCRVSTLQSALRRPQTAAAPRFSYLSRNQFPVRLYAVVTNTIRLRFDGRSTAYQRSLRSQWRNPLAAVTPTCLFI